VTRDDWAEVERFGSPTDGLPLAVRPSAYGLFVNGSGDVAIVSAPDGIFLPGGGVDEGETPEEALRREAREECGWEVTVGTCVARAVQYAVSNDGRTCNEKRSYFFEAAIADRLGPPLEPGHETMWVAPVRAKQLLKHESHARIVAAFVGGERTFRPLR
jgi:8-oxo-dGTP diphosphatase